MAVVVTKDIKRKRMFLAVFVVLVLAAALIVYFGIFNRGAPPSVIPPADKPAGNGQVSELKVKILEDERFKNLLSPPGVPLKTETTGKSNPFSD